jgi:hypothetical protein
MRPPDLLTMKRCKKPMLLLGEKGNINITKQRKRQRRGDLVVAEEGWKIRQALDTTLILTNDRMVDTATIGISIMVLNTEWRWRWRRSWSWPQHLEKAVVPAIFRHPDFRQNVQFPPFPPPQIIMMLYLPPKAQDTYKHHPPFSLLWCTITINTDHRPPLHQQSPWTLRNMISLRPPP